MPMRDAVAFANTVNGFLTATTVKAAADAAIARIPVFRSRDLLRRSLPSWAESSSEPDRKRGTESSGRNSSRVTMEREG